MLKENYEIFTKILSQFFTKLILTLQCGVTFFLCAILHVAFGWVHVWKSFSRWESDAERKLCKFLRKILSQFFHEPVLDFAMWCNFCLVCNFTRGICFSSRLKSFLRWESGAERKLCKFLRQILSQFFHETYFDFAMWCNLFLCAIGGRKEFHKSGLKF